MNTEQLNVWRGRFGADYMLRNQADQISISNRINLWAQILKTIQINKINSILEVGSNIGLNLRALKLILQADLFAIEPYQEALDVLIEGKIIKKENAFCTSAFDCNILQDNLIDLVFTSGVLIHIHPNDLKKATDNIIRISKKFVLCIEYFSDKEETIPYHNHQELLFKRDFGIFYLDLYPQLQLRDYGFAWKHATGLDNLTWWLFEKI